MRSRPPLSPAVWGAGEVAGVAASSGRSTRPDLGAALRGGLATRSRRSRVCGRSARNDRAESRAFGNSSSGVSGAFFPASVATSERTRLWCHAVAPSVAPTSTPTTRTLRNRECPRPESNQRHGDFQSLLIFRFRSENRRKRPVLCHRCAGRVQDVGAIMASSLWVPGKIRSRSLQRLRHARPRW